MKEEEMTDPAVTNGENEPAGKTDPEGGQTTETEEGRETLTLPKKGKEGFVVIEGKQYPADLVEKARKLGWKDKDFVKGKGQAYYGPDEFIERGEKVVPFLNKRITKLETQNETLQTQNESLIKMVQNQIKDSLENDLRKVNNQLRKAKDEYDPEELESLVQQKVDIQSRLKETQTASKTPTQPAQPELTEEQQREVMEMKAWEIQNDWLMDGTNPKSIEAKKLWGKINQQDPNAPMKEKLEILEISLAKYDETNAQKRNVSSVPVPPPNTTSTMATGEKTVAMLKSTQKEVLNKIIPRDLSPEQRKVFEKEFLKNCNKDDFRI